MFWYVAINLNWELIPAKQKIVRDIYSREDKIKLNSYFNYRVSFFFLSKVKISIAE
jgi:hypothetical protein